MASAARRFSLCECVYLIRHGGGGGDDDNNDEMIVGVGIASLASSEVLFIFVLLSTFRWYLSLMFPSNRSFSRECDKKQFLIDDA